MEIRKVDRIDRKSEAQFSLRTRVEFQDHSDLDKLTEKEIINLALKAKASIRSATLNYARIIRIWHTRFHGGLSFNDFVKEVVEPRLGKSRMDSTFLGWICNHPVIFDAYSSRQITKGNAKVLLKNWDNLTQSEDFDPEGQTLEDMLGDTGKLAVDLSNDEFQKYILDFIQREPMVARQQAKYDHYESPLTEDGVVQSIQSFCKKSETQMKTWTERGIHPKTRAGRLLAAAENLEAIAKSWKLKAKTIQALGN